MAASILYVNTARLAMAQKPSLKDLEDLEISFIKLQDTLKCSICGNILRDPHSPLQTICQHNVCKLCLGGVRRLKLKSTCRRCNDSTKYEKNTVLLRLLECYKGLCSYVKCSNLFTQLGSRCDDSNNDDSIILNIIEKGSELKVDEAVEVNSNSTNKTCSDVMTPKKRQRTNSTAGKVKTPRKRFTSITPYTNPEEFVNFNDKIMDAATDGLSNSMFSIPYKGGVRNVFKRAPMHNNVGLKKPTKSASRKSSADTSSLPQDAHNLRAKPVEVPTILSPIPNPNPRCRCGSLKIGALTCCGPRCPCFAKNKACINCKCKGCRNPLLAPVENNVSNPLTATEETDADVPVPNGTELPDSDSNVLNNET